MENHMRTLYIRAITLSIAAVLAACSSTPQKAPATTAAAPTAAPVVHQPDSRAVATVNTGPADPLDDPKGVLAQRSVYFDFDSYVIKSDYNQLINNHSKYLEAHTARKIIIQGNTDERGGSEYNLALGQKRAEAARKAMAAMGVSESQMEAVSFGKEKPKAAGHDEAAWSQNRRDDIVYAGTK
jgi:peptidoglycan-associated lipoprotein